MISRRTFLEGASATAAVAATISPAKLALAAPAAEGNEEPIRYVDPRIGTGGHGHCYPGATLPFGAVQLSPDTYTRGWDWCSGYHDTDGSIMGFSHTHLSGTGAGDLLDFLVMAGTGPAKIVPGSRENPDEGYRSRFDHASEVIEPGYYAVRLNDYKIKAELTATERTGLHRYTFPASEQAYLILDLKHGYGNTDRTVESAELQQTAPDTLAGGRVTSAWGPHRHVYFTMTVSKRPERVVFFSGDKEVAAPAKGASLKGRNLKCVLYFKTAADEQILVKTGISGVSAEGAAKNLAAESPGWRFDETRRAAYRTWQGQLNRIHVETAKREHKQVFYTALYHLSLGPTLFDDVDGTYRGMDGQPHTLPKGEQNYTTFSLWDTYRAAHPTYTLINPERVPDFVNTLVRMAEQSPAGMPVWPLQGTETGTMTGYHSASVISEARNKSFGGVDWKTAYAVMLKRADTEDFEGLGYYRKLGYIPADKEEESVSKTLEYCYNDWAIAHVAKEMGNMEEAERLVKRSTNYRNYFEAKSGFLQPKLANGQWAAPFDPVELGHSDKWRDYTESNPWQTTFAVQHDIAGLMALFGGREPFVAKLDGLFEAPSVEPAEAPPDIAGLIGQYAHGNEPSHHIAYMYVYAGVPHKTQARVRSLMEVMYSPNPDGMQGNEDVGQMSAWYILSALGFYPVDAVSGNYVLGSPLFDRAAVELGGGKRLEIEVERKAPTDSYVHGFTLNGKVQEKLWFRHADVKDGGRLVIAMGNAPHPTLGTSPEVAPPSLTL